MTQANSKIPISVFIRTLNEERCIQQVLEGVLPLTDDVILVDSGSTDRTLEIAQTAHARVIPQKWLGSGHQKRVGEDAALHDWVLDLDADEVLSQDLQAEIRTFFQNGNPEVAAFSLRQTQVFPSGYLHPKMGTQLRVKLYNKQKIRIPAHVAWDQFTVPNGMKVPVLKGPLWHYAFETFGQLLKKQEGNMTRRITGMGRSKRLPVGIKIVCGFPFYFFKKYFMQGCWRGGMEGFIFAALCAFSSWMKHVKLYERDHVKVIQTDLTAQSSIKLSA